MKTDVFAFLHKIESNFKNKLNSLDRQLNALHKDITLNFTKLSESKLASLIELSRKCKQQMKDCNIELFKINEVRKDLNEHIKLIKETLIHELTSYNLYYLSQLFFSKIEINNKFIIYHVTFGEYFESEEYDNDLRA